MVVFRANSALEVQLGSCGLGGLLTSTNSVMTLVMLPTEYDDQSVRFACGPTGRYPENGLLR